jgi:hypothetical protein
VVVEAIFDLLFGLAEALFSFLASILPAAPTFWTDLATSINELVGLAPDPILNLVPLSASVTVGLALVGILFAVALLKLARRVVSLFTGGGGNA